MQYALLVRGNLPIEPADALVILDEATDVARELGDRHGVAVAEAFRGTIASREGSWPLALRSVVGAVTAQYYNDPTMIMAPPLYGIAIALCRLGDLAGSAIALGFVEAHYAGFALDPYGMALLHETETMLTEELEPADFERLRAQGAALDLRQMIASAKEVLASMPESSAS